jgi:hypothetical protein
VSIVFFKTGWMARYRGLKGDRIFSTMSYVRDHQYGHERDNFKPKSGKCFGYAPVAGVNIQRLGGYSDAEYIEGVDVIWAANRPRPLGGLVIIGWYRNARVYRHQRPLPSLIIAEANAQDCALVPVNERFYELPLKGPGSFRSAKVWYGDGFPKILRDVQKMLNGTYRVPAGRARVAPVKDPDITRRAEVEKAAIERVTSEYVRSGFNVESVEEQKRGWDLEATGHNLTLLLEVKGTAHPQIMPLLTPREYQAALANETSYHVCIVTSALSNNPSLLDLRYASDIKGWISEQGTVWDIVPVTAGQAKPRK